MEPPLRYSRKPSARSNRMPAIHAGRNARIVWAVLIFALLALAALLAGCANKAADEYATHSYQFRRPLVLDNDQVSEIAKEQHLYLLAAALGVPPDKADAWVEAVLAGDDPQQEEEE